MRFEDWIALLSAEEFPVKLLPLFVPEKVCVVIFQKMDTECNLGFFIFICPLFVIIVRVLWFVLVRSLVISLCVFVHEGKSEAVARIK